MYANALIVEIYEINLRIKIGAITNEDLEVRFRQVASLDLSKDI